MTKMSREESTSLRLFVPFVHSLLCLSLILPIFAGENPIVRIILHPLFMLRWLEWSGFQADESNSLSTELRNKGKVKRKAYVQKEYSNLQLAFEFSSQRTDCLRKRISQSL